MKKIKYFAAMDDGTRQERRGYVFDIVERRDGWRALSACDPSSKPSSGTAFRVCVSEIGGVWVPTEQTTGYALPPYSAHTMIGALHVVCMFAPEIVRGLENKRRADNREVIS
jgi:hypothetical protein